MIESLKMACMRFVLGMAHALGGGKRKRAAKRTGKPMFTSKQDRARILAAIEKRRRKAQRRINSM
jgi:hypothetical protein